MQDPQTEVAQPDLPTPAAQESGWRLLTTQEVEAFEALSLEVFGASSRWSTMLKKGIAQPVTEKVTEYKPADGDKPEEMIEHDMPVYLDKAKKSVKMVQRYFTPETLMVYMVERKRQIDAIKAMIAEQQRKAKEAKEKADLEKKIASEVSANTKIIDPVIEVK